MASVDYILNTFNKYLQRLHESFEQVAIGDNPDISAEGPHDPAIAGVPGLEDTQQP